MTRKQIRNLIYEILEEELLNEAFREGDIVKITKPGDWEFPLSRGLVGAEAKIEYEEIDEYDNMVVQILDKSLWPLVKKHHAELERAYGEETSGDVIYGSMKNEGYVMVSPDQVI